MSADNTNSLFPFFSLYSHSEHQELAKQIQETEDTKMKDDLERELDELVTRMEAKGDQIASLKRHKVQVTMVHRPCQNILLVLLPFLYQFLGLGLFLDHHTHAAKPQALTLCPIS